MTINLHPLSSLSVMNISFVTTTIDVMEAEGVAKLMLRKTDGAIGPVSIRIFTIEETATGNSSLYCCYHNIF